MRAQGIIVLPLVVTVRVRGGQMPAHGGMVRVQGGLVPAHCGRVRARGGLMPAIGVRVRGLSSYGARLRATARQLPSSNIEVLFLVGQRGDRASFARTLSLGRVRSPRTGRRFAPLHNKVSVHLLMDVWVFLEASKYQICTNKISGILCVFDYISQGLSAN